MQNTHIYLIYMYLEQPNWYYRFNTYIFYQTIYLDVVMLYTDSCISSSFKKNIIPFLVKKL